MTTNAVIISDALRLLGVIAESQSATANQGAHALRVLNQMMEAWAETRIELGYFTQDSTADECPIPLWAERGVTSKLAQALKGTYGGSSLLPEVLDDNLNGFGAILRYAIVDNLEPADMSHMAQGEAHGGAFDITTG